KPAREGSTIGLTKVGTVDHGELPLAYGEAVKYDDLVLVEEFVTGMELTVGILAGRALPLIRIEAPQGNYDYHAKYFSDETKYFCPCGLPDAIEREIQAASVAAFDIVGCTGWGRLDLILRADGSYSFLEVNTSPGMTGHSLVPMAARQALTQGRWGRRASLRRQWPQRVEVTIEEHEPLARWNGDALVNVNGEVFSADFAGELPQFEGTDARSAEVAARYREWSSALGP